MKNKSAIIIWAAFLIYVTFLLRGSFMDTGKAAIPVINAKPQHLLKIKPVFERLPDGVNLDQYQFEMSARYETHKNECGITKKLSRVLIWTLHDAPVEGNIDDGFEVWRDRIVKDKCDWKLMHIELYIRKDNMLILNPSTTIDRIMAQTAKSYCIPSQLIWNSCTGQIGKSKQINKQDPNEWEINFIFEEITK
jgi:hypothetical protein